MGVGLCAVVVATIINSGQASASTASWGTGAPFVQHTKPISSEIVHKCRNTLVDYNIAGEISDKLTCINETGPLRFGYYLTSHGVRHVVGFGREKKLYRLNGIDCDHTCIYSPEQDTLVARRYLINGFVKSLVIYKNFSSRINIGYDVANYGGWFAEVSDQTPTYTFKFESGYAYPVNGMGLSSSGRYLGFEVRQRGLVMMDLQTMVLKRISNFGYSYGVGMDPEVEIAVSDDGDTFAAVGENAGIKMFSGLQSCGDEPTDDNMSNITAIDQSRQCAEQMLDSSQFIGNFKQATLPRFTPSSLGLQFFASSYSGETRDVYIKSAGSGTRSVRILGMGDSYSSGEGDTDESMYIPYTDTETEKCHTSIRSYSMLAGERSGMSSRTRNLACSGAVTEDIFGNGNYIGQGGRLKGASSSSIAQMQRDALSSFIPGRVGQIDFVKEYQPEAIMIGIGGNDVDLVGKLKVCMGPGSCHYAELPNERLKVALQIRGLYDVLHKTYSSLHVASPTSRIYAVGYPQIISEVGDCDLLNNYLFDSIERRFMRQTISYINQVVEAAAIRAGIKYIDIEDIYGNATLCGEDSESVMNGIVIGDDVGPFRFARLIGNESFHPKPAAHSLVADRILGLYPNLTGASFCGGTDFTCPVANSAPELDDYWTTGADTGLLDLEVKQLHYSVTPTSSSTKDRQIGLDIGSFKPNSNVSVGVRSEMTVLGDYNSEADGSFQVQINLPEDLPYGYHTLILTGENSMGEPIEYQQIFLYEEPATEETNTPESQSTENISVAQTAQPSVVQPNDVRVVTQNGEPAVLGSQDAKGVAESSNQMSTAVSTNINFWLALLGVGALSSGLFVAVLYIRKSRNTIKT